ncbi:hypothetical protein [Rhizobium hidalgonense]|uniref:Uncharacterized protein n=2 Tax=Rhizobium hidalgonense TaxID=1538159 RepID=A0AAJ2LI41_9HYPH|nr:hypothetical protein [Rhizobium hidalgonense]MDR9772860.1 hypothetical protein [Rhizobium hidalgonense]MDR9807725.1 hypothetical protein [Rhizobium hidalgonense]MDR9812982.1 hypothetical protein [Rhizobium hidalgonense]MDR9820320.1 hypothetical protein [Rhizobium hidalgonense]
MKKSALSYVQTAAFTFWWWGQSLLPDVRIGDFASISPYDRRDEMASNYRLEASDTTWAIVDIATDAPARLDGIPLVTMEAAEARHMLRILYGIDQIRTNSRWWAKLAKKRAKMITSSEDVPAVEFEPLRPFVSSNWT